MNLCGVVNDADKLLIEIPDQKFELTPRKKDISSMPLRTNKTREFSKSNEDSMISTENVPLSVRHKSRASYTTSSQKSPTFLNPLPKDVINKADVHQQSHTNLTHRRKLEIGYNIRFYFDQSSTRSIRLNFDPENMCLRIQPFKGEESDSENDGSSSNFAEISLKLNDITRLEVGREKSSKKTNTHSRKVKNFSIITRKTIEKHQAYNFEANSLLERDTIISGIKCVLELTKGPSDSRKKRGVKTPKEGEESISHVRRSSPAKRLQSYEPECIDESSDSIAKNAAVYFDFKLPMDGPEAAIETEMRNDTSGRNSDNRHKEHDERDEAPSSGMNVTENTNESMNVVAVRGSKWSLDDIFCGLALTGDDSSDVVSPKKSDHALKKQYLCTPNEGCDSRILTTVEDADLVKVGIHDISAGPFCTDDVCTATFKDLTDTMKGVFDAPTSEGESVSFHHRAIDEKYTGGILSGPANLLAATKIFTPEKKMMKANRRRIIQNRSRKLGAQAARLKQLQNQMRFRQTENAMPYVQVVCSYDDIERSDRFGEKFSSDQIGKWTHPESAEFLQKKIASMETDIEADEDVLYYDSDPEDAREQALRRGPRRAVAELQNCKKTAFRQREALSEIPMSRINLGRKLRRSVDDETIIEIIERMKNEKMVLMWHPACNERMQNRAPFCSKVWIESGIYLIDGTFLLPKLTWVPVFEENIQRKVLNVTIRNPGVIDLLDVCRVRECKAIDRKVYPYASVDCSFIIQTQKETQLFEAQSRDEKIRVVNAMRLVIARLASLLMLRDLRAVDEFFGGNSVPGEAPAWAKKKEDSSVSDGNSDHFP